MTLPAKLKRSLVISGIAAGLLLLAGAAIVAWLTLSAPKLKMVSSVDIKQNLKLANDANVENFDVRAETLRAIDEQQVPLVTVANTNPTALKTATETEINRRITEIQANKKLLRTVTPDAVSVKKKIDGHIDTTLKLLTDMQTVVKNVGNDSDKIQYMAVYTDVQFEQYANVNRLSKLLANQQTQVKYADKLQGTVDLLQKAFDAAKSNGATHVNAGPAGFVSLERMKVNLDKLKQSLAANSDLAKSSLAVLDGAILESKPLKVASRPTGATVTVASSSSNSTINYADASGQSDIKLAAFCIIVCIPTPQEVFNAGKNLIQGGATVVQGLLTGNAAAVQSGLNSIGVGVTQVAQISLGAVGVNVCVSGQDCSRQTNLSLANICMNGANCSNSTNVAFVNANIGGNTSGSKNVGAINTQVGGNSSGSTNVGAINSNIAGKSNGSTNVGILNNNILSTSNGSNNIGVINSYIGSKGIGTTNTGVINSNIASNTSGSTNTGILDSTLAGNNSNSTNNAVFVSCAVASNCSGSKNTGFAVTCTTGSTCTDSTNTAGIVACGLGANCSGSTNNGAFIVCGAFAVCTGSTNNGFMSLCIGIADCSNSTNNTAINVCAGITNCSTAKTISVVNVIKCDQPGWINQQ